MPRTAFRKPTAVKLGVTSYHPSLPTVDEFESDSDELFPSTWISTP